MEKIFTSREKCFSKEEIVFLEKKDAYETSVSKDAYLFFGPPLSGKTTIAQHLSKQKEFTLISETEHEFFTRITKILDKNASFPLKNLEDPYVLDNTKNPLIFSNLKENQGYSITGVKLSLQEEEKQKRSSARNLLRKNLHDRIFSLLGIPYKEEINYENILPYIHSLPPSFQEIILHSIHTLYSYGLHSSLEKEEIPLEEILPVLDFVLPTNKDLRKSNKQILDILRIPKQRYLNEKQGIPIKLALFDAAGVCHRYMFPKILQWVRTESSLLKEEFSFAKNRFRDLLFLYTKGFYTFSEFSQKLLSLFCLKATKERKRMVQDFFTERFEFFRDYSYGMEEIRKRFKKIGITCVVVSDSLDIYEEMFHGRNIDHYFLSHKLKSTKKEGGELFDIVLKEMNTKPEDTLLFDDKPENIFFAQKKGIAGVCVDISSSGRNTIMKDITHQLFQTPW
jgi:FMN phosphatase YigB (HAD superfamily)